MRSRVRSLIVAIAGLALLLPATGHASHASAACESPFYDPLICPAEVPFGASCISHGVLVVVRDGTGTGLIGDTVVDHSRSEAWLGTPVGQSDPTYRPPLFGLPPVPTDTPRPGLFLGSSDGDIKPPPSGPQHAHGDAAQVGFSYSNALLSVKSKTVHSSCDVDVYTFGPWAYGRAGVEDLTIDMPIFGFKLWAKALEQEVFADKSSWKFDCETAEVGMQPGNSLSLCPMPNTDALGGLLNPLVTVELNEQWGPVPNRLGRRVHGGSALHVTVAAGLVQVDVYVGYVAVSVA